MLWAWYVLLALLALLVALAVIAHVFVERVPAWSVSGKRVLITGGSSGVSHHAQRTGRDALAGGARETERDGAGGGRDSSWLTPMRCVHCCVAAQIGLATAELLATQGAAAITIMARDQKKIDEVRANTKNTARWRKCIRRLWPPPVC